MHEYGVGLRELEEYWTDDQFCLFVDRIIERKKLQSAGGDGGGADEEVSDTAMFAMMGVVPVVIEGEADGD